MNTASQKLPLNPSDLITKDLLELLDVSEMSQSDAAKFLSAVYDTIQTRILVRILNNIAPEDIDNLEQVLKEGDDKKIENILLKNNLPSLQQLAAEEALLYKVELVNEVKQ